MALAIFSQQINQLFMKKFFFLFCLLRFAGYAEAATIIPVENPKASEVMIPLEKGISVSLEKFVTLSPKEYKLLTGKKLGLMKKMRLKFSQRLAKKMIHKDGTADLAKLKKYGFFGSWQWHWGGFALGFLVLLGPIICLFINDDYKWDRFWTAMTVSLAIISIATVLVSTSVY